MGVFYITLQGKFYKFILMVLQTKAVITEIKIGKINVTNTHSLLHLEGFF